VKLCFSGIGGAVVALRVCLWWGVGGGWVVEDRWRLCIFLVWWLGLWI